MSSNVISRTTLALFVTVLVLGACARRQQQEPVATPTPGEMDAAFQAPPVIETAVDPLPTPVPTPKRNSYIVKKGDSLWMISGEAAILGDNFRWPLMFKANRDQIIDPDLIEPQQDLTWKENYTREEVEDAVGKAKETPAFHPHATPRKQLPLKY